MSTDDRDVESELRALLAQGRKIDAIKRYREATGAALAEAKEAVEALERGESPGTRQAADSWIEAEIVPLLEQGRKIEAIRLYREKSGVDLKEAKDAVEAIASDHRIVAPSGSGCLGVLLLLMLLTLATLV